MPDLENFYKSPNLPFTQTQNKTVEVMIFEIIFETLSKIISFGNVLCNEYHVHSDLI